MNPTSLIYGFFKNQEENRKERSFSHYPSGVCALKNDVHFGKCRRQLFYEFNKVSISNPIDESALFKMHVGNLIHSGVSKILQGSQGIKFLGEEVECKWQDSRLSIPFSGRIDNHIEDEEGKSVGCEWKSTWGAGVNDIRSKGIKEEALFQVICYLNQPKVQIDYFVMSYIARDSGYIYSFRIDKADEKGEYPITWLNSNTHTTSHITYDDIIKGLISVEEAVAKNEVPERDYEGFVNKAGDDLMIKSDWHCRYCSYRNHCYGIK